MNTHENAEKPLNGYTVQVGTHPEYYGQVSDERAREITEKLAALIRRQFPGIEVDIVDGYQTRNHPWYDDIPSQEAEMLCSEIETWIEEHWTAAL